MISYSPESMRAFTAFYRAYNDIDIYVEDNTLIGLYERTFTKILEGLARISSVTPLAGRRAVIAEAVRLRNDRSRKRFFLLDGDFFWILGPVPRIRDVYMLNCYSFENLAFERLPMLAAAYVMCPERSTGEIDAAFSQNAFDEIAKILSPLFQTYAIAHNLDATCETVGFSVHRLTRENGHKLDPKVVRKRIREVLTHLRSVKGWGEIIESKRFVREALRANGINDGRFISGKGYLAGLLLKWFQLEANYRGNVRQLISSILERSSLNNIDPQLVTSLVRCAR